MSAAMVELRPRLYRYCARMMGSMIDGEDVVQDALARAVEALPRAGVIEKPESWLFRIAHTTAIDALRKRRRGVEIENDAEAADVADPLAAADTRVAASASLAAFLRLAPLPRAAVLMMDVLEFSQAECVELLGITLPTLKAALNRGRIKLAAIAGEAALVPVFDAAERRRLIAYADAFNGRDFDRLRGLLAEDVSLDLANRVRMKQRTNVSVYFTRYSEAAIVWRLRVAEWDGRLALLAADAADPELRTQHVIFIDWVGDKIGAIHDFHYATYAME